MDSYEQLLDMALEKVPKKTDTGERFVMPKIQAMPAGAKTIITNFSEISATLRRDPKHIQKYLLKELATSGEFDSKQLTVIGRFPNILIDRKLEMYVNEYVICPDCKRPDTNILKDGRMAFLRCEACGAKTHVKDI